MTALNKTAAGTPADGTYTRWLIGFPIDVKDKLYHRAQSG